MTCRASDLFPVLGGAALVASLFYVLVGVVLRALTWAVATNNAAVESSGLPRQRLVVDRVYEAATGRVFRDDAVTAARGFFKGARIIAPIGLLVGAVLMSAAACWGQP